MWLLSVAVAGRLYPTFVEIDPSWCSPSQPGAVARVKADMAGLGLAGPDRQLWLMGSGGCCTPLSVLVGVPGAWSRLNYGYDCTLTSYRTGWDWSLPPHATRHELDASLPLGGGAMGALVAAATTVEDVWGRNLVGVSQLRPTGWRVHWVTLEELPTEIGCSDVDHDGRVLKVAEANRAWIPPQTAGASALVTALELQHLPPLPSP